MSIPEFTCLCPKTGQPDFATLELEYVPNERCVELKSLKLYIWSFRSRGAFHEAVTNEILRDLVAATAPRFMRILAKFNVRGGHLHHRRGGTPRRRLGRRRTGGTALRAAPHTGDGPAWAVGWPRRPEGAARVQSFALQS